MKTQSKKTIVTKKKTKTKNGNVVLDRMQRIEPEGSSLWLLNGDCPKGEIALKCLTVPLALQVCIW